MGKVREIDEAGVPYCPKCHSTHLSVDKKGFGVGKAVAGVILTAGNPFGLLAVGIEKGKIKCTCLKCGHKFTAGKG